MTAVPLAIEPDAALCRTPPSPDGMGGLLVQLAGAPRPLPLAEVKVRARIVGGVARTVVEQRFQNGHDQPLEAVHIFPLPEKGAVVEVELQAGETIVRAECRERKEAEQVYAQAQEQGHRAALLTQERDDVHTLRVTNLPPKTDARVRIVVEQPLELSDGMYRWRFPTVVAPRFTPGQPLSHQGPGTSPDTDIVADASRLTPPVRLDGGTKLDLEVEVAGPVRRLASSLHALRLDIEDGGVRVAPSGQATLNRDFILSFATGDAENPALRAWSDGQYNLVQLDPPTDALPAALPRDAVFVLDISGSMSGQKLKMAKLALKTALHGLMPGDRFRLIAFDDRVEVFHADWLPMDDRSVTRADAWIDRLHDRGGTVMAPAMEEALKGDTPVGRLRTVLFVTDGQSTDEDRLLMLVHQRRGAGRVFPLGIDTAVNAALLERVARIGGGVSEFCTPQDDIEAVVARLEARFGSPVLTGLTVEGGTPASASLPDLFSGRAASFCVEGAPEVLRLRARAADGERLLEVRPRPAPFPLGPSFARERVASLQDRLTVRPFEEEAIRPEIIRIALAHGIATRWTAFVAVDRSVTTTGQRIEVVQPVELPAEWEAGAFAPMDAMMAAPALGRAAPMAPPSPAPMMSAPAMAPGGGGTRSPRRSRSLLGAVGDFFAKKKEAAPPAEMADMDDMAIEAEEEAPMVVAESLAEPMRRESARTEGADPDGALARMQAADGSFGGDITDTVLALLMLLLRGHTRRAGLRKRTVQKAASWLQGHRGQPLVDLALGLLERIEAGETPSDADWETAISALGPKGARLRTLRR